MKAGFDNHEEAWFRKWFRDWSQRTRIKPDLDDANAEYDFRKMYLDKRTPDWSEEDKKWTWPDDYKIHKGIDIKIIVDNKTEKPDGVVSAG